ncbi:rod shape-determining protein MreC [Peptacetobacter hominis]|uniref:Cell shape-determining protein MreC n=1 Tax=Peptacetobacter hominis TaxID=2743610 RepID=A0A544QTV9_9FIRM|nr:rod shape-determining protein MreC [Peptacetobacter hominis]TQQ84124.1 rod shape-determining protein MreC [Peptacetobacter hominis]
MKFDKFRKKKPDSKVIATVVVAITLIGITGISIAKFSGAAPVSVSPVADGAAVASSPVQRVMDTVKEFTSDFTNFRSNGNRMRELEEENETLKKKVIDLSSQSSKYSSLNELKKSLNYVDSTAKSNMVSASVIEKNDGNWYETFVISAGKNDGVQKNSIVINGSGLVGMVYEVSANSSKVISLLDSKTSVSFKIINNTAAKGVISASNSSGDEAVYQSNEYLGGYMFDSGYEVVQGDIIVTSGLGLYPENIPIGEVEKVIDDKNRSMKSVVIKPYVNFKDINDVTVIAPRNIE